MTQRDKYPPLVYKYRNWVDDNHKSVLRQNKLFFTSPKDFNDPFDYKIPHDYSLLNTDEKITSYLNKKKEYRQSQGFPIDTAFIQMLEKFGQRIKNEPDKVQEEYNSLYFEGGDNHYGVLSLSERWDSILMWSHYGDFHKGYCVGLWEEKMRNSILATGGRIYYPADNEFPKIDPLGDEIENMVLQSHAKSSDWKYEEEYRLSKVWYPEVPTIEQRIQVVPNDFFAEIIIGLSASTETRKEIIQLGKEKGIKVYQAIKGPSKFAIERTELV